MSFFKYILKFLIIAFCVAFVVLNMQDTTFYYSPIATPLTLPLWMLGLLLITGGFLMGGLLVWLNESPKRAELRRLRKEIKLLEDERDTLENEVRENGHRSLTELENTSI